MRFTCVHCGAEVVEDENQLIQSVLKNGPVCAVCPACDDATLISYPGPEDADQDLCISLLPPSSWKIIKLVFE